MRRQLRQRTGTAKEGTATLELVLSMPVLLVLMVAVVWLGFSVVAQTEVTVEARHKAWAKRENPAGKPLLFLRDDVEKDSATQEVEISPLFDDVDSPESSHDVMVGSWDFEKLDLGNAPNWKEYALAAANAKTGSMQTKYVDASNKFTSFKRQSSNLWKSLGADLIRQLTDIGDAVKNLLKKGESQESAEKQKERSRIESDISAKKQELQQARQELRNLDSDASKALKKVLENRVDRLKAELKDLESDLEAIE